MTKNKPVLAIVFAGVAGDPEVKAITKYALLLTEKGVRRMIENNGVSNDES